MYKRKLLEDYIINNLDNIYRFAYTYVKNKNDAEDVVSESVIKALAKVNSLKNPEYIKAWFYKIIQNTAISLLKKQARPQSIEEIEKIATTDNYEELMFCDIMDKLEIKYREIVVLKFLEDMSIKEIADVLKINENTAKTRLYKALKILRIDMEGEK